VGEREDLPCADDSGEVGDGERKVRGADEEVGADCLLPLDLIGEPSLNTDIPEANAADFEAAVLGDVGNMVNIDVFWQS